MNAKECLLQRRSCRKYKDERLPRAVIREIVDMARFAPSWHNTQIVRYTVIDDKSLKCEIAEHGLLGHVYNAKTLSRAAAVAVISYVTGLSGREDGRFATPKKDAWEMFDAGCAVQSFCLAARECGVGTCILGVFDGEYIRERLRLPADQQIACLVAMGYPEEWKTAPPRREADDILSFCDGFGKT